MQVLLVEDDRQLAAGLQKALHNAGFACNHVETGAAALLAVKTEIPDIVLLDIGLPDTDGITVLKALRKTNAELSVILLTARDSVEDKVAGLDSGADDYLAKPFDVSELLARLRAVERRLGTVKSNVISLNKVDLDTANQFVSLAGTEIDLSRKEYMLLKSLMENAGRIQTRSSLESKLYSWGEEVSSNAVEVHIHHLRKKLGERFIKTVRGVGYKVEL
jgi:DNA-binding response OmpR family regulator